MSFFQLTKCTASSKYTWSVSRLTKLLRNHPDLGEISISKTTIITPCTSQLVSKTHKINPFTAQEDLCGGKIKFFDIPSKSIFLLLFDLHSPPGSIFSNHGTQQEPSVYRQQLPGRRCHCLPVSPQLPLFKRFSPDSFSTSASETFSSFQPSTPPGESLFLGKLMYNKVRYGMSLSMLILVKYVKKKTIWKRVWKYSTFL